ncbi:MAG: AI-2E family transporter [Gammaproteobacteria bacterium]|nr:MAG: AI-2E family transporter [Gammaproteobacteria bacterium]RLA36095.1 MAG: AI-2E family transporter [Gammaproteobacteria bacterium]
MNTVAADRSFQKNAMASFVQIGALLLLLIMCFKIISPFLGVVAWAMIIAVALYPAHVALAGKLGGREKTSAVVFVFVGLAILIVPTYLTADSTISALSTLGNGLRGGTISVSPPDESVAGWPIIGEKVYNGWTEAADNLEETLRKYQPQLATLSEGVLKFAGSMALGVLQFILSIIIAGVFLVSAKSSYKTALTLSSSLMGGRGNSLVDLSVATIRSVAKGVLGVAIIQAVLSAIGLAAMDIPAAGLWAGAVLILAIVQLPPLVVLGPIAFYVFSIAEPVPATIFAAYCFIISISDSFLKPMFLGRGMEIPMLVILIGAIGGAILGGIIGLFVGAIALALGYEILDAWMKTDELNNPKQPIAETAEETS